MFRLLSKEVNIFSIPTYIGILLLIILSYNYIDFNGLNIISNLLAFLGVTLGYILFNKIALNRKSHLPMFLYTIFILSFYTGHLDIGISVSLFINSILLFFLTDNNPKLKENSYLLIGNLLGINYIFLPTTWPLFLFILIHIIATSDRILFNIFNLFFGIFLIFLGYIGLHYFLELNDSYTLYLFPNISQKMILDFSPLYALIPIAILGVFAIIDHFIHFNEKSPRSKFKYSFILAFLLAQCLTLIFYMGQNYEYLLLVIFPMSVILSRFLRFINKKWMREAGLWMIILCLFLFKINLFTSL